MWSDTAGLSENGGEPLEGSVFDSAAALEINEARLRHLASLGLELNGRRVLDAGSGPGHLAQFFVQRDCAVLSIDGRSENIETLRATYPHLEGRVVDVEKEDASELGAFDVVFCYGLLYHTTQPERVLENLSAACKSLLLLETCVLDSSDGEVEVVADSGASNQGLRGDGCRPSPAYVIAALRRNGFHVYLPKSRPKHADFLFSYLDDRAHLRQGSLMRQIFVASRTRLKNRKLRETIDGHELHDRAWFEGLPLAGLQLLARLRSRPEPLEPFDAWQVGATEASLPEARIYFKRLWDALLLKSERPVEVVARWHHGLTLRLPLNDEIARCVFVEGLFEPTEFWFLDRYLRQDMVFVDAGANNGLYTLFAGKKVGPGGRVLAFEPSKREFAKLQRNIRRNHLRCVQPFLAALGAAESTATLHVAQLPFSGHNSLGEFGYPTTELDHDETVPVQTLDFVAEQVGLGRLDIVKIDVEGAELAVLQGARKSLQRYQPLLLIELSDRTLAKQSSNSGEVITLLRSHGYELFMLDSEGKLAQLTGETCYDGQNVLAVPPHLVDATKAACASRDSTG